MKRAGRRRAAGRGCAGTELKERTDHGRSADREARDDGAQRCAPVELAMAESHNEFAQHELTRATTTARRPSWIAETNAKAAIEKSPKDRCVDSAATPVTGDNDGDGIPDNVDKCPTDPEDKDGFQDEDGCPDPDNDGDGIPDKRDKCPNEPEDKDGFQDDDGCPDPDNDGDGIADDDRQVPERARGQGRLRGRRRLPRPRQRQGRHPRPRRQVPATSPGRGRQRRLPAEVPARRRHRDEDRAQADGPLRHQQGDDQAGSFALLDEVARC